MYQEVISCLHRSERYLKSCRSNLSLLSLFCAFLLAKGQSRQHLTLFTQTQSPIKTKSYCLLDLPALGYVKDLYTISVLLDSLVKDSSSKLHHLCFRRSTAGTSFFCGLAQWLLSILLGREDISRSWPLYLKWQLSKRRP